RPDRSGEPAVAGQRHAVYLRPDSALFLSVQEDSPNANSRQPWHFLFLVVLVVVLAVALVWVLDSRSANHVEAVTGRPNTVVAVRGADGFVRFRSPSITLQLAPGTA